MYDIAEHRPSRGRVILAAITMVVPALAVLGSFLLWSSRLPERVASHWSGAGAPDDSLPTMAVFVAILIITALCAVATLVLLALPRPQMRAKRMIVLLIGLVAGSAAAAWIIPTWLTLQAGSVGGAELGLWGVPMMISSLWGVLPALILPAQPLPSPATATAAMELRDSEVGAWSRSITGMTFVWATLAMLGLCAAISIATVQSRGSGAALVGLVVMILAALVCASFIQLRVSVDWRGLRVVSLFGVPLKRIPLDRIDVVEATDIRPMDWGGWGYRVMPGRSAVVLRHGPALMVTMKNEKQFAVTIDDPEQPAGLLQALAARAESSRG